MERLHMIVDVSHLSDRGFWDIAEHSTRPFAASHSNCRALAPHCRNLTDEMIRVMAEKGGLVGLNYCSGFLDDQPRPELCRSTTALMARHAAHFKQVGGIEIIGLGSDFDGIGGKLEMGDCSKLPLLGRRAAEGRLHRGRGGADLLPQRPALLRGKSVNRKGKIPKWIKI